MSDAHENMALVSKTCLLLLACGTKLMNSHQTSVSITKYYAYKKLCISNSCVRILHEQSLQFDIRRRYIRTFVSIRQVWLAQGSFRLARLDLVQLNSIRKKISSNCRMAHIQLKLWLGDQYMTQLHSDILFKKIFHSCCGVTSCHHSGAYPRIFQRRRAGPPAPKLPSSKYHTLTCFL